MIELNLTEDQIDCLQELTNVAIGQTSDQLARYLDTFVQMNVPTIELTSSSDMITRFAEEYTGQNVFVVTEDFSNANGVMAEALLVYQAENGINLASVLAKSDVNGTDDSLTSVSSVLMTQFLQTLSEQLQINLKYCKAQNEASLAVYLEEHLPLLSSNWELALKIDMRYQVADHHFSCDMVLLLPEQFILDFQKALEYILNEI